MAPTDSEHYRDLGRPNYHTPQPLPNSVTIFMNLPGPTGSRQRSRTKRSERYRRTFEVGTWSTAL